MNDGKSPYGKGVEFGKNGFSESKWRTVHSVYRNGELLNIPTLPGNIPQARGQLGFGDLLPQVFSSPLSFGSKIYRNGEFSV